MKRKQRSSSDKKRTPGKPGKPDPAPGQLDDQELDGVAGGTTLQPAAGAGIRMEMGQSRTRQSQNTQFGSIVKQGLSKGADVTVTAGQLAAPFIPGAAVVSAASDDDAS